MEIAIPAARLGVNACVGASQTNVRLQDIFKGLIPLIEIDPGFVSIIVHL